MKQQVISEKTTEELKDHLIDQKEQLKRMYMSHAVSQLENPMVLKQKKRTIARIKTELRKRELNMGKQRNASDSKES